MGGFLMAKESRPKGYPKLKNYKLSQFMLPTSHYDKKKADRAVTFIENLCHIKGKWLEHHSGRYRGRSSP